MAEPTGRRTGRRTNRSLVLVVDDAPPVLETYVEVLAMAGYMVRTAADGATALRLLAHEDIKLVLMDLVLPDMRGLDVLMRIKEKDKRIEVVIATGNPDSTLKRQAMQAGAYAYLVKPFPMERLLSTLAHAVERRLISSGELDSSYYKPEIIIRSIEFPPEYYQAGLSILSYFYQIIHQKYPNIPVKINIE